jgi:fucose permease
MHMETQTLSSTESAGGVDLAVERGRSHVRPVWVPFSYLAIWGYILYGLGNAVPYLHADLHLSDFEAGLHSSAMAVGLLLAGIGADPVVRRIGTQRLLRFAVMLLVASLALIMFAPGLPVSLTGALLLGLGGGVLVIDVNVGLGKAGGSETRKLLVQANAISVAAAGLAPLAIGLAASALNAWRLALLIPVVALLALAAISPREPEAGGTTRAPSVALPKAYWFAWLLLMLSVSIEFSFVFWGSTIVAKQTGVPGDAATLLASLFVVGMLAGRVAIGRGLGAGHASHRLLAVGLCGAMAGAALVWVSPIPAVSALGLLVGGAGTAGLFPIGLSIALDTAPLAQMKAAARVNLAAGGAALVAPSALGLAADAVGVVTAWLLVLGLAACAMVVLAMTPRRR